MGGFMKKMGFNLEDDELYERAFQKGVLLNQYGVASDIFDKAAKRFTDKGNPQMATRAAANALLYRYLTMKDNQQSTSPLLQALLQTLYALQQQGLQEIEAIGPSYKTESMSISELCAELVCRLVEVDIDLAKGDQLRSHDLHKIAFEKFQVLRTAQLKTYTALPATDGHNDKAIARFYFHSGMSSYYDAMLKKNYDPSTASDHLAQANQFFSRCNDQKWQQQMTTLLTNWRSKRTCWICHRDMQGYELHYSMCDADVTPYAQMLLEKASQESINLDTHKVAVCTTCGSMVMYKAQYEANVVRRELNAKLDNAMNIIQSLNERINHLERRIQTHHH